MPDLNYMELNLMQILDVLRAARVVHLAVSEDGQPYAVPMFYQLEVVRGSVVIHLATPDEGRKLAALRRNAQVCLSFELPGCAWLDTVIVEGRAAVGMREDSQAADVCVLADGMSGRRYFLPPD